MSCPSGFESVGNYCISEKWNRSDEFFYHNPNIFWQRDVCENI